MRFLLGVAVLVAVVLLALRINLHHVGPRLDYGSGFLSGVLATSLSTNGPPLVFVLQARQLLGGHVPGNDLDRLRAQQHRRPGSVHRLGQITRDGIVAAAVTVPAMLFGQFLGFPIRKHVHGERFRWLVLVLLVAAAISAIVNAIV